jgi:ubiquinone/menaquinone biosynthesis C-methylase UbiE/uncharacterized protein YbaR (Trm112 family)
MWKRFSRMLRCPQCSGPLGMRSFNSATIAVSAEYIALAEELELRGKDFTEHVDAGLLLCDACRTQFPIVNGVPVMLCYTTPLHRQFSEVFGACMNGYEWPNLPPPEGEVFAMRSFSDEWREYRYDGVLWHNGYEDLENTFLKEVGFTTGTDRHAAYLEIGCGIGVTSCIAQKHYRGEAVGIDLSLACMKAAQHYRSNPFMHFVQASAFALPFAERSFNVIYSRGVLHHTYSTHEAFRHVARLCSDAGAMYIWVYGPGSNEDTLARRIGSAAEIAIRPILSRWPSARGTKCVLALLTVPYRAVNWVLRLANPEIQEYTYERALHAARDRFTPRYAHRHEPGEVTEWFREAGFESTTVVDWRSMPAAQQDTYRRNVGVRGRQRSTRAVHGRDTNREAQCEGQTIYGTEAVWFG